jgi:hypothetical protein
MTSVVSKKWVWCWIAIFFALIEVRGQSASTQLPRFEDYPAGQIYKGPPAELKLDKPWTRMYATVIRDGVEYAYSSDNPQKGANFAGHLIVVKWGCGAPCLRMAIVDAESGEIYYPPITFEGDGPQNFDLPLLSPPDSVSQNPEVQFRPNSNLIIIKATPSPSGNHPSYAFYFLWRRGQWTLLRKVPLTAP